jgi:two-component system sensor histidine kinase ChiS
MSNLSLMKKLRNQKIINYILLLSLFLTVLFGLRWGWMHLFAPPEHPHATEGVLDLRGWDFEQNRTITLDGEWEFFPSAFLYQQDFSTDAVQPNFVQVPGDWRDGFAEEKSDSFGYGTYRLRILVDQPLAQPYAFWIHGIEASFEVEINGKVVSFSIGSPGERKEAYTPKKTTYMVSYEDEDVQELELLIRVTRQHRHRHVG